jgi:hypothetical protein
MNSTSFKASVDDLGEQVRPKIEEAKQKITRINGQITSFIQEHPGACLLGAIAMGYLVARVARRQR